jgi:hypothetical protein
MHRLASDEDFNGRIVAALRRRDPTLDLERVQDAGLRSAPDPVLLAWAATEGRVLLTHDRRTMPRHAYDRVTGGLPMPGVLVVRNDENAIGALVEEILIVLRCTTPDELRDRVWYLPL